MNNVDKLTISAALIKQALDAGDFYDVDYNPNTEALLGGLGGAFAGRGFKLPLNPSVGTAVSGAGAGGYATQDGVGTGLGHGLLTMGAAAAGAGLGRLGGRGAAKGLKSLGGSKGVGKMKDLGGSAMSKVKDVGEGAADKIKGLAKGKGDDAAEALDDVPTAKAVNPQDLAGDISEEVAEAGPGLLKRLLMGDPSKMTTPTAEQLGGLLGGAGAGAGAAYGMGQGHKAKLEAKALMNDPSIKGMILRKLQEMGM